MKEKRKHPRVPVGISMDIRAHGQSVGVCRGSIQDLSVGGMAFKSNAALEEGMTIYLKINIPLEIRGEVRHSRGSSVGGMHRYGVLFHKIGYVGTDKDRPETFISAKFLRKP